MLLQWIGDVCSRDPKEIQDGGLQAYGIPLVSNWRKIDASGLDEFDLILYRQLIGSLESALDDCEAYTSLHQRNNEVWIGL